ncbi:MAG: SulP family inorganic anion transporter [Gammaproteobacteria bacterium]
MTQPSSLFSSIRNFGREDLLASLVVFLVALPLSMGIAVASGVPLEKAASVGLITAIIGGLVVGPLSGSPLQVSGPAAGLTVMVALFIQEYGFATLGLIVLGAGLIQLLAAGLRLGQVFRAVSPALIQGMLGGIGILIFASQFHVMVDDLPPGTGREFGGIINLMTLPQAVSKGVSEALHRPAALTGLLTISSAVLWELYSPKRLKALPAPLIGVVVATACAATFEFDLKYVPVPDQLSDAISLPDLANFDRLWDGAIWLAALSMAFVASAESLLTATAVDFMQHRAPRTRHDRELAAQGAGNMLCGLLGVLPVTGVIVRSSANVHAGARTRLSSFLHGFWLLLFVAFLPFVLSLIPVAGLAAILVYTGIKLTGLQFARILWRQDRAEAAVYVATLSTVVFLDLLTGIMVGIVMALARLLYSFSHLYITVRPEELENANSVSDFEGQPIPSANAESPQIVHIHLQGAATFLRLPQLAGAFENLGPSAKVRVHVQGLNFIDHACLDLLKNWEKQHRTSGGELRIDWNTLNDVFRRHAFGVKQQTAKLGKLVMQRSKHG